MGTVSSAKVVAIPIMAKPPEPTTAVATEATAETTVKAFAGRLGFAGAGS